MNAFEGYITLFSISIDNLNPPPNFIETLIFYNRA